MPNDQLLLAQVATGDEEALRQLYHAYRPRLRRYLWHQLGGDAAAVDEALQDVFLAVWRTADSYRAEARVSTWLYQIAHYTALGARRRLGRRLESVRLDAACDDERLSDTGDVSDAAPTWLSAASAASDDSVLNRLALGAALARLSPKHREALALVFQHGFSLPEVAQILDIPVGTVKSRISYARQALLRELDAAAKEEARHDA